MINLNNNSYNIENVIECKNGQYNNEISTDCIHGNFNTQLNKFIKLTKTSAFNKIIESADSKPKILIHGIIALVGVGIYLYEPNLTTIMLAKTAWGKFISYAKQYRIITSITDKDIEEYNLTVVNSNLPNWMIL